MLVIMIIFIVAPNYWLIRTEQRAIESSYSLLFCNPFTVIRLDTLPDNQQQ